MKDQYKAGEPNRDPITGAPGAHPVGVGAGAAAGGAAGAAAGTAIGGPVGTVVGAVAGAIAGGLAGKGVAEMVDPTAETTFWHDSYKSEPYYTDGQEFTYYEPAYRTGWEGRTRYDGKTFEDVEDELARDYRRYAASRDAADWDEIRPATRAAWDRIDARVQSATRN
jgi:hypothetical protein